MVDNMQASNNNTKYQIAQYKTTYSCDKRGCSNTAIQELKNILFEKNSLGL